MDLFKAIFETVLSEESEGESDQEEPSIGPPPPPDLEAAEMLRGHGSAVAVGELLSVSMTPLALLAA